MTAPGAGDIRRDPEPGREGFRAAGEATGAAPGTGSRDRTVEASPGGGSGARPIPQPWGPADWDRYQIQGVLGSGGMGLVYRAWDPRLKRSVALKFHSWGNADLAARFLSEARSQARIDHPNICKVFEAGEVHGVQYIAMALVEGRTLREAAPDLSLEEKVAVMADVAEAIHAAHRLGIIHRDLKPTNIMVSRGADQRWFPVVLDFGLARAMEDQHRTQTGVAMGTPSYMSPEQAKGRQDLVDRRSDIYSLGVTLYELFAGTTPFATGSAVDEMVAVMTLDPPRLRAKAPQVPVDLETIVMKCMEKDPDRRYDSARALVDDLRRFLDGEPVLARAPSAAYRAGKWLRRNRTLALVSGGAVLLVLGLGAWGLRTAVRARAQAQLAERFGHEAQAMESDLRLAYSLPLHDTRPEAAEVRERMKRLEAEMAREGSWARGPGLLAEGRAAFFLGETEEARGYLEEAWKLGYRSPEVAGTLGLCLARLYQENLADLGGKQRENRKAELEEELRRPAEAYLRQSMAAKSGAGPYAEGILALTEERFDAAVERARAAQSRTPWLFEAGILEALAREAQGDEANRAGRYGEALDRMEQAGLALDQASRIARSSPQVLNAESVRRQRVLQVRLSSGKGRPGDFDWALAAPERALQADPQNWRAFANQAGMCLSWAVRAGGAGEDPLPILDRGIQAARASLRGNPDHSGTLMALGSLHRTRGEFEAEKGLDPRRSLNEAIAAFQQALRHPRLTDKLYGNLGTCYGTLGEYQLNHGEDPTPAVAQAIACHEKALAIRPFVDYYLNIGFARVIEAQYQMQQGQDPLPQLEKAIQAELAALALNPNESLALVNLAGARVMQASYMVDQGRDAGPCLALAREAARKSVAQRPDQYFGFVGVAQIELTQARWLTRAGGDPGPYLQAARAALAKAARMAPGAADLLKEQGDLELETARWQARKGSIPADTLRAGQACLKASLRANPTDGECALKEAELLLLSGKAGDQPEAQRILAEAVRLNPNLARQADRLRDQWRPHQGSEAASASLRIGPSTSRSREPR